MRKTVIFTLFSSRVIFYNSDRLMLLIIICACKNDNFSVDEGILEMSEATRM